MKKWIAFICLIIYLTVFHSLRNTLLFAQYLDDDDEDVELQVWNLRQQIKIEEESIESLKRRRLHIIKEKQRIQKVIQQEKQRVKVEEETKRVKHKLFEVKRSREEERQLFLLEHIMLNQEQKRRFLERIEQKRNELGQQKREQEKKLSQDERELKELGLELINQREQKKTQERDRQMQLELEEAHRKFN